MLKEQLTSRVAGIILQHVRERKGRLTMISDESRINRKHFNVRGLSQLKLHQLVRIVYALKLELMPGDYDGMMEQIMDAFDEFAEEYDFTLLEE